MAKNTQQHGETVLDSRVVQILRTTKVSKGGRAFSFCAYVVVGDKKGAVGYGRGKAKEVSIAVQKGTDAARRNMEKIQLTKTGTIHHPVLASHGATTVMMKPAASGTGIIAGGAMRDVFEVLGMKSVSAKITGSRTPSNVIIATVKGLVEMHTPKSVAERRGKSIKEILGGHHGE
jgi:small subunit ribosomal protein S5